MSEQYIGMRFGCLTVTGTRWTNGRGRRFDLRCDCGNEIEMPEAEARKRKHCSDKCQVRLRAGSFRAYKHWTSMRGRVAGHHEKDRRNYVNKGIVVCKRWEDFFNFLEDMGEPPAGYTLDRIDSNGIYCPQNCRWASYATQNRNTSRNRMITIGDRTLPLVDWLSEMGMHTQTFYFRVNSLGMSDIEALTTKSRYTTSGWTPR